MQYITLDIGNTDKPWQYLRKVSLLANKATPDHVAPWPTCSTGIYKCHICFFIVSQLFAIICSTQLAVYEEYYIWYMVTIDAINTWENTDRNGGDADSDVDDGPVQTFLLLAKCCKQQQLSIHVHCMYLCHKPFF